MTRCEERRRGRAKQWQCGTRGKIKEALWWKRRRRHLQDVQPWKKPRSFLGGRKDFVGGKRVLGKKTNERRRGGRTDGWTNGRAGGRKNGRTEGRTTGLSGGRSVVRRRSIVQMDVCVTNEGWTADGRTVSRTGRQTCVTVGWRAVRDSRTGG